MSTALEIVVATEGGLVATAVSAAMLHFARVRARVRRWRGPRREALAQLAEVAVGRRPAERLPRLPRSEEVQLFAQMAPSLGPEERRRLAGVAELSGLVDRAERWTRSRLWWRRLRGARLLNLLGRGEHAMPPLFDDPHPEVRAEAAAWAAGWPVPSTVERLLDMLGDPRNLCRFTVKDSLLRLRQAAVEPLARRVPRLEGVALREALDVATGLRDPRLLPPVLPLLGHADPAVRAGAAGVAGAVGGTEAVAQLVALLDDPAPGPRAAAARSLGHLGHWPAGAQLAAGLRDEAWDVRRAAALALRGLGAPGALLLRRALSDDDPFARDMARQTLDLPAAIGDEAVA